ncbi:MAG: SDR family oxidoreductase [Clostridiales bacterium]|nr:SDR family oxidoreductase [Clostridiales bacterium]
MAKTVWITGASSGLGLHTAMALIRNGFQVAAGARSFGDAKNHVAGCLCLPLDVTQDESIDAFVSAATSALGAPDILINCAGMLNLGACESYAPDEVRQIMETNFLGQVRMISRALPLMREKGKGRIVNFSSINGLMGIPFQGAYAASKHAIEGYSECLRLECRPFGIEVMVVRPGDHRSGGQSYRRHSMAMDAHSPYWTAYEKACQVIAWDEGHGCNPDKLGEKIAKALRKKRLPGTMRIAKFDQHLAVILHDLLPTWLFERIIASYYKKTKE